MKRLAAATLLTMASLAAAACARPGDTPPTTPAHRPTAAGSPGASARRRQPIPADRQQLENSIRALVAEVLRVTPDEVDVSAPLSKQKVAADELDTIEIVMEIEETFGIEIRDEEISGPDGEMLADLSVKRLADVVAAKSPRK